MKQKTLEDLKKDLKEKSEEITRVFNELSNNYNGIKFDFELTTTEFASRPRKYDFIINAEI